MKTADDGWTGSIERAIATLDAAAQYDGSIPPDIASAIAAIAQANATIALAQAVNRLNETMERRPIR